MSVSLKVEGGDLVVGTGRAFETVTGSTKLAQDLRLWVLAKMGQDPSTPDFGTTLDGGIVDGAPVDSMIGQLMSTQRVLEVRSTMIDLLTQYQSTQLARIKQDMIDFNGKNTLDSGETLQSIVSVEAQAVGDTIIVRATVKTMANATVNITLPVSL